MKTKKYINKLTVIAVFLTATFASCSDEYFEADMGGRITPDQHYTSIDDVKKSYDGCFSLIQDIAEKQVVLDGLRSDLMDITNNATSDMININNHEFDISNSFVDLSNYYKIAVNVNEVLPYLNKVLEIDRDFDSLEMARYTQQLITLRSWAYFNLARLTGKVDILNESNPSNTPESLSKSEVFDRLISDLLPFNDEQDILRSNYKEGQEFFIQRNIDLYVLLGELYLEKNDYANAIKYLKFAVDGPAYSPSDEMYKVTNVYEKESWSNIFLHSAWQLSAVRSAIEYSFYNKQSNHLEEYFVYNYNIKPSNTIIEAYESEIQLNGDPGDIYRGTGVSYDTTTTSMGEKIAFITKYSIDQDVALGADIILYRSADIHLMLAEALNRSGDSEKALLLLNRGFKSVSGSERGEYTTWSGNIGVRGRAYLEAKNASGVDAIEDLIIEERMKELAFEGKRWFDLVRIAERRGNPAYLADKVAAKFEGNKASEIKAKLMETSNWYLPN